MKTYTGQFANHKENMGLKPRQTLFNKVSSKFRIQIKQRVLTHTLEAHTAFGGQRQNSPQVQGQSAPQREFQAHQD